MRVRFRALTTEVEVVAAGPEVEAGLGAVIGTFRAGDGPAMVSYRLEIAGGDGRVSRGGELIYQSSEVLDLVPAFEGDLYRETIRRCGADHWVLHAATVVIDGIAVVLAGNSGDGKSTAALALVAGGACYLGDEHVAIDRQARVHGMARPIAFLGDPAPPPPAGFRVVDYPMRDASGHRVVHPLFHPPASAVGDHPAPLGLLVRLRRRNPDAGLEVRRLGAGAGLASLWELTLNPSKPTLEVATDLVARVPVCELCTGTIEQLVDAVVRLAGQLRRPR